MSAKWIKEHFNKSNVVDLFQTSEPRIQKPSVFKGHPARMNKIMKFTSTVCLAGWFSWHRRLAVSWSDRITSRFSSSSNLISCRQNRKRGRLKVKTGFFLIFFLDNQSNAKLLFICWEVNKTFMWKLSEVKGLRFVTEEAVRVCVSPHPHTHTV